VFPTEYVTRVRYTSQWNNTTASPGIYDWIIRGNGAYDPQYGAGGESPAGWTELAAIYEHYNVIDSTVTLKVLSVDSGSITFMAFVVPNTSSTSLTAADPDCWNGHPGCARLDSFRPADGQKRLISRMSTKKILAGLDDATTRAATNATPNTEWYWHILTAPSSGAAAASAIVESVVVDYTVHFYGLKALTQSVF